MADLRIEFSVEYEGETIPVTVTEIENEEGAVFLAEIPGHPSFEIFLSEDDMWVTNDDTALDEDLIFLIGDEFENLQP